MIERNSKYGSINITPEVVATIVGGAATECYGVIGMASQQVLKDGFYELLKKDNYTRGVIITVGEEGLIVDLYIIVGYGMKISEIVTEVQKKVKYVLETTLDVDIESINVYVQGVRVVK